MWRLAILIFALSHYIQVNCQTTKKACDIRVPDSPLCGDHDESCTLPEKAQFCQRYCGICDDVNAPTGGLPTTRFIKPTPSSNCSDANPSLCTFKSNLCNDPTVQQLCCKTCFQQILKTTTTDIATKLTTTMPPPSTTLTAVISSGAPPSKKESPTTLAPSTVTDTTAMVTSPAATTKTQSTGKTVSTTTDRTNDPSTNKVVTTSTSRTDHPTTDKVVTPSTTRTDDSSSVKTNTPATVKSTTVTEAKSTIVSTETPRFSNETSNETETTGLPTTTAKLPPADSSSTRISTPSSIIRTTDRLELWKKAVIVQISKRNDNSIEIKVTAFGYLEREKLDKIIADVTDLLKDKVTDVNQVDVEDGQADESGNPVTVLTLKAEVKPTTTSNDLEKELNGDASNFRSDLSDRLSEKDIELFNGDYHVEEESPEANKATQRSWAENNWYVIFAIGLAALIIVGLIVMAVTTASSRKKQKLRLQEKAEKLAYTKV